MGHGEARELQSQSVHAFAAGEAVLVFRKGRERWFLKKTKGWANKNQKKNNGCW